MFSLLVRLAACVGLTIGITATAGAQSDVRRQQALTEAYLKQAGVKQPAAVETDGILMYGSVPDAQAKALADNLQRVYQASRNALNFAADDALWPGKLTVVVLSDAQQFADYYQKVTGRLPADGQTSATSIQGDMPYLIIGPATGTTAATFDPSRAAATMMAAAVLNRRAGTGAGNGTLPVWLTGGFAEGMIARTSDDSNALSTYRNTMRTAVLGDPNGNARMAVLAESWSNRQTPANTARSAAFVEYLMDRMSPAQFNRFLGAFREVEGQPPPTLATALRTLPLSRVSIETDFKVWAAQQK
jgi:hypothetical protein